jgi:exopolysaccharide biosynthesis polyprenyl glycosylphosphotransferase
MASVGEWGTSFRPYRRTAAADAAAAFVGAAALTDHRPIAAVLFACALLSHRRRTASSLTDARQLVERLVCACVVGALIAPPLTEWAAATAGVAVVAIALRHVSETIRARAGRAWAQGLPTILVGDNDDVRRAAQLFATHPEHGVRPVATATTGAAPTVLPSGGLDDLLALVREHEATHVLVVSPSASAAVVAEFGRNRPCGVRVSVLSPMAEVMTHGVEVVDVRGLPFLTLAPRRTPAGPQWIAKRVIDFVGAAVALLLVVPVLIVTSLAIVIDSGRPVFFRQKRVGRDGRLFDLWKFRTMVVDAEQQLAQLRDANEAAGPYFKIEDDPRVTRVGRLLRRLSIDEIPQIFNVLRGEMSLVGPRPFLPSEMEEAPELFEWRLPFTPGITGMWQVAGRSWLPVDEGLRMDLSYVEHWSLGLDLRIILRTVRAALHGDRRPSVVGARDAAPLTRARYLGLVESDDLVKASGSCDLSIVVVTHESRDEIVDCLDTLLDASKSVSCEVIVVDNASTDGTADLVAEAFPEVRLIRKRRRDGFSTNVNIGVVASRGRHLLLLNPDTRMFNGTIDRLVDHLDRHPEVGIVGPRLIYPNGAPQASARRFPTPVNTLVRRTPLRRLVGVTGGTARHLMKDSVLTEVTEVDWLLGAAMAIRADAYFELGGLDDAFRLYCEDVDLCWRMHEAGWRVEYLPTATVEHALGELTAKRFFTVRTIWHFRSMWRFVRLHGLRAPQPAVTVATARRPRAIERIELLDEPSVALTDIA